MRCIFLTNFAEEGNIYSTLNQPSEAIYGMPSSTHSNTVNEGNKQIS